ncbi:MAG: hypothetical protein U0T36_05945 [Saprospiraceae bacterium]
MRFEVSDTGIGMSKEFITGTIRFSQETKKHINKRNLKVPD